MRATGRWCAFGLQAKAVLLATEGEIVRDVSDELGGVHVPDSDNVAEIKVGDALEVEKVGGEARRVKAKAFSDSFREGFERKNCFRVRSTDESEWVRAISEAYCTKEVGRI